MSGRRLDFEGLDPILDPWEAERSSSAPKDDAEGPSPRRADLAHPAGTYANRPGSLLGPLVFEGLDALEDELLSERRLGNFERPSVGVESSSRALPIGGPGQRLDADAYAPPSSTSSVSLYESEPLLDLSDEEATAVLHSIPRFFLDDDESKTDDEEAPAELDRPDRPKEPDSAGSSKATPSSEGALADPVASARGARSDVREGPRVEIAPRIEVEGRTSPLGGVVLAAGSALLLGALLLLAVGGLAPEPSPRAAPPIGEDIPPAVLAAMANLEANPSLEEDDAPIRRPPSAPPKADEALERGAIRIPFDPGPPGEAVALETATLSRLHPCAGPILVIGRAGDAPKKSRAAWAKRRAELVEAALLQLGVRPDRLQVSVDTAADESAEVELRCARG